MYTHLGSQGYFGVASLLFISEVPNLQKTQANVQFWQPKPYKEIWGFD